jgi:23S rRNA pseudouridine2457 synthase
MLRKGVLIEGKKTLPAQAKILEQEPQLPPRPVPIRERKNIPTCWLELTLSEGRNRQVRKMTAAVGCPTLRLVRVQIGNLDLFSLDLEPGQWTDLNQEEVTRLFD